MLFFSLKKYLVQSLIGLKQVFLLFLQYEDALFLFFDILEVIVNVLLLVLVVVWFVLKGV
jgi:hypothetical protein